MWRTRGHDGAIELLTSSLAQGRVSHAYLITGPERIGKALLAHELAMALNCTAWQGPPGPSLFGDALPAAEAEPGPCYQCASCLKALAGSHPDIFAIERWTTERGQMTDQVRAVQYGSGLLPFEGHRKVYLLLNAQDMTAAAQNTLLKTLEEPAPTVCLILSAPTPRALLPTVVSRCQHVQLRAPSTETIQAALAENGVDTERAHMLASMAAGRIGWALAAAEDPALLDQRQAALDAFEQALAGGTVQRFRLAEALAGSDPDAVDSVLELWLSWLRDLLLVVEGLPERIVHRDQLDRLQALAAQLDGRSIQTAIRSVQAARSQVVGAINTRMSLEVLMLRLPRVAA